MPLWHCAVFPFCASVYIMAPNAYCNKYVKLKYSLARGYYVLLQALRFWSYAFTIQLQLCDIFWLFTNPMDFYISRMKSYQVRTCYIIEWFQIWHNCSEIQYLYVYICAIFKYKFFWMLSPKVTAMAMITLFM